MGLHDRQLVVRSVSESDAVVGIALLAIQVAI